MPNRERYYLMSAALGRVEELLTRSYRATIFRDIDNGVQCWIIEWSK